MAANNIYKRSRRRFIGILSFLLICLGACAALSVCIGQAELSRRIFALRFARVCIGLAAGAGLAACGAVFQAILRNPLSEPYVLGVSSGAGLGAVTAAILFGSAIFLPIPAFLGAIATIFLVYNLSRVGGRIPVQGLLLSGVIINILFSSLILFLISVSRNPVLHDSMWWLLGNLQVFDITLLISAAVTSAAGIAIFMVYSHELDAISIGEEEAIHLGINTEKIKGILFIVTSLVTAMIIAVCGLIGFVGLIVPHICRFLVGPSHRRLIPASAAMGAIFIITSDVVSRTLMPPIEIPVGVVTSIFGAPFFLFLLRRSAGIRQK